MNKILNCDGALSGNRCKKLKVGRCLVETCVFYQTAKQAALANNRVNKRLAELDMGQQQYIADKYYGGKMPWLKGGADNGC